MNCQGCDQLQLQRITTRGYVPDVELVKKVSGKKPYLVRCKKCGREWKTNAEYAQKLSGDFYQSSKRS